jgi:hypothetical protein
MSAIDRLPAALRTRGSVISMANKLDRTQAEAARLRKETRKPPALTKVAIPGLGASFAAGLLDARMPDTLPGNVKPSVALGLVSGTAAWMMENEMGIYAAVGLLAPAAYAAGVKAAGNFELAIVETTPDAEPTTA